MFRGRFPFSNVALRRTKDFNLANRRDADSVDKHLTDFIGMKQEHSGNKHVLEYLDTRNSKRQAFVRIPETIPDQSNRCGGSTQQSWPTGC
mmetsp:Transcript_24498/g.41949  ORF Transcript_24498/g.41949 Transcript_24498/m.41949 type:complete len:91 (-) Transcript_24498:178-450(-)